MRHPEAPTGFLTKLTGQYETQPTVALFVRSNRILYEFSQSPPKQNAQLVQFLTSLATIFEANKKNPYIHKNVMTSTDTISCSQAWNSLYQRLINERSPFFGQYLREVKRRYKRSSFFDYRFRPILLLPRLVKSKISYEQSRIASAWHAACVKVSILNHRQGVFHVCSDGFRFRNEFGKDLFMAAEEVTHIFWRWSCHVPNSIEIFLSNRRGYFFTFPEESNHNFVGKLTKLALPNKVFVQSHPPAIEFQQQRFTERWLNYQMTTYDYLTILNLFSGRSFNNLECYPVFPWVVHDYESQDFDPERIGLRDLRLPVGAFSARVLERVKERNAATSTTFLYANGYSNSMILSHYLLRLEPFSSIHIQLQDGHFDSPNRLFQSIGLSYSTLFSIAASSREICPEFFFCPEFLVNLEGFEFGQRVDGCDLNAVELPKWANDPVDFIRKHLKILESTECARDLPEWIDLIWGSKQTGDAAVAADNTFDPLMYNSGFDGNDSRRQSILQLVGQIPWQLFTAPHPSRSDFVPSLADMKPMEFPSDGAEILSLWAEGNSLDSLKIFVVNRNGNCCLSRRTGHQVVGQCGTLPVDPRFFAFAGATCACVSGNGDGILAIAMHRRKILKSSQQAHIAAINCIASSGRFVVTGGCDALVALWALSKKSIGLLGESVVHNDAITAVAVSSDFGIAVSCSRDGKMSVLKLPKLDLIRPIDIELEGETVPSRIIITKGNGDIIVFCEEDVTFVRSFTLNCVPIKQVRLDCVFGDVVCVTDRRGFDFLLVLNEKMRRVELIDAFSFELVRVVYQSPGIRRMTAAHDCQCAILAGGTTGFVVIPFVV
jgi:hypothetical protein